MRVVRVAGVLASGLLTLGLAQAPSSAAHAAAGTPGYDSPTASELRALAETIARPVVAQEGRGRPPRVDVVRDPRGDAEKGEDFRGPRPFTRLADVTRLRYKTPSRDGGDLRVTSRWADLRDGSRPGVRRQAQVTFFTGPREDDVWAFVVTNRGDDVRLFDLLDPRGAEVRVRPEELSVERSFGPGGTTDVVMSTEWLGAKRVVFSTMTLSGADQEVVDSIDDSRVLHVGPVR